MGMRWRDVPEDVLDLRPLGAVEILDATWLLFLRAPGLFLGTAAAFAVVSGAVGSVPTTALGEGLDGLLSVTQLVVVWLCPLFAATALAGAGADVWLGRTAGLGAALAALRRPHTVLWVGLLFALVSALPLVFSVYFSLALVVLAAEGGSGLGALGRSFGLLRGSWWRTLAAYILATLLIAIAGWLPALGAGLLVELLPAGEARDFLDSAVPAFVGLTVSAAIGFLVPVAVYVDARIRREGMDVTLVLDSLDGPGTVPAGSGVGPGVGSAPGDAPRAGGAPQPLATHTRAWSPSPPGGDSAPPTDPPFPHRAPPEAAVPGGQSRPSRGRPPSGGPP